MNSEHIRIAALSKGRTLLFVGAVVLFCVVVSLILLWHPVGETFENYHQSRGFLGLEKALLGLTCVSILLLQQIRLLFFLATRAPGVWLSDGLVCYVNNFSAVLVRKIPCNKIFSLSVKSDGMFNRRGVLLDTSGTEMLIPTWLFLESSDAILSNLQARMKSASTSGE